MRKAKNYYTDKKFAKRKEFYKIEHQNKYNKEKKVEKKNEKTENSQCSSADRPPESIPIGNFPPGFNPFNCKTVSLSCLHYPH